MKFTEAYHPDENSNIPLETIVNVFNNDPKSFENRYRGNLFCPKCHEAKLYFSNAKHPYLGTYHSKPHAIDCSLSQKKTNSKSIKTFLDDSEHNEEEIRRQLHNAIHALLKSKVSPASQSKADKEGGGASKPLKYKRPSAKAEAKSKRIPRKRIDGRFRTDDYARTKVFYGTVYIKWEEKRLREDLYHYIRVSNATSHKLICSVSLSPSVYENISDNFRAIDNTICEIAFVGDLNKPNEFEDWNRKEFVILLHSSRLKIYV